MLPFTKKFRKKTFNLIFLIVFLFISLSFYQTSNFKEIRMRYNYTLYCEDLTDSINIFSIIDNAQNKLRSENIILDDKISLFFSKTEAQYYRSIFFNGKYSLAMNYLFLNRIIISPSNLQEDRVMRQLSSFTARKLSDVIVHEVAHNYLYEKIGFFKYLSISKWKNEGFCDYISNSSSFDIPLGIKIFIGEKNDKLLQKGEFYEHIYAYFEYRLIVDYLFHFKKINFNDFIKNKFNLPLLKAEIKKNLISGKYVFPQSNRK